jgi:hypothetical protein
MQAAPERDQQLPGECHNPNLPEARTPSPKPRLIPLRPCALGLKPHPAPRNLHSHRPHVAIASLRDPEFPGSLATLVRRRREAGERPDLLGRLSVAPGKAFHDK